MATELRALAERVLHGRTLEDKLWAPADLVDVQRGAALERAPVVPGRPDDLCIRAPTPGAEIPRDVMLRDPAARARLLHAFANHELQAIELMALALLRFPDAPAGFRRGLAAALGEEQSHLLAYVSRLRELGTRLGDHPPSAFFWRVMAPMHDPIDFLAHLSLTFEQANLDFARHYARALREVGDEPSAAILERVYEEEIGHVKLGLVWFRRWTACGPALFAAHVRALREPMTPRRARGIGFDREGRRRAGLPDDYVEELAAYSASRGRAPTVHVFDPTAELVLARGGGYTPDAGTRAMIRDLSLVPAFVAARDDVVIVPRRPGADLVRRLVQAGIELPQLVQADASASVLPAGAVSHARLSGVVPWGWSVAARRRYARLLSRVQGTAAPPPDTDAARASKATWVALRAECHAALPEPWLDDPSTFGVVAHEPAEVIDAVRELAAAGHPVSVVKAIFGTAGKGAQRIRGGEPDPARMRFIERTLEAQGAVVVEPWLRRVCDVSLRITVDEAGRGRIDDFGRFLTDDKGQYVGAVLGPIGRAVPPEVARWLHGDGRDRDRVRRVCEVVAARTATLLHSLGHVGPAGIDGLVHRDREGDLRLRPVVEVNARMSFGHVAVALGRRIAAGSAAVWLVVPRDALPGRDFAAWIEALDTAHPLRTTESAMRREAAHARGRIARQRRGRGPQRGFASLGEGRRPSTWEGPVRIVEGVLPTCDPETVERFGSVLLVAPNLREAERRLQAAAPSFAARLRGSA